MGLLTGIAWAGDELRMGATWNPWQGCTKIRDTRPGSPGSACDHCYAEAFAEPKFKKRLHDRLVKEGYEVSEDFSPIPLWGPHGVRQRVKTGWNAPKNWNSKAKKGGYRLRVFVASLADVFETHSSIKPEWRDHVFELIETCKHLDWQVLTKRPGSVRHMVPGKWLEDWPKNCWLGTSVEHAGNTDRIDQLLAIPGGVPVRFLSCEPLLSDIDLGAFLGPDKVNWLIAGGESGTGARKLDLAWVRSLRDQCVSAKVPFFYKQPGTLAGHGQKKAVIYDIENPKKNRDQWRLDGRAWWQWPELPGENHHVNTEAAPRKRGRPTNVERGLLPSLDDKGRQSKRRAMERHARKGGWAELVDRWLGPLPKTERKVAAAAVRRAITNALKKP